MTTVEIILLLIGVVFMIGSFFVTEKLSQKEVAQISELSSMAMKHIVEKNMGHAKARIAESLNQVLEQCMVDTRRAMERETNLKIQDISEYSETVLEDIHKNHSEVMFLYSMLNDKHAELTQIAGKLESQRAELERLEEEIAVTVAEAAESARKLSEPQPVKEVYREPIKMEPMKGEPIKREPLKREPLKEPFADIMDEEEMLLEDEEGLKELEEELTHIGNQNQNILELYKKKMDPKKIARQLGVGIGEVKLVIDLYRGEGT